MKKVFKYGTGQEVPEGSQYLSTLAENVEERVNRLQTTTTRYVWHYFLVEVKDK